MPSLINRDRLLIALLALVALGSGGDILSDLRQGVSGPHILQESVLLGLATVGLGGLLWGLRRQQSELQQLKNELSLSVAPSDPRLTQARQQLGEVIRAQFCDWGLSPGETEIAWLLLKGLSLKEIALLRGTSEKTVRQQASSVYQKAALPGRHAFAAWFIEDLL